MNMFSQMTGESKHKASWEAKSLPGEDWPDKVIDLVNHPPHYTSHKSGIECIQITEHMSFLMGNAMKYLWRADLKNGVEDLQKAIFYINREIQNRTKKG